MKAATYSIKSNVNPVGFPPVKETLPGAIKRIVEKLKPEKIILFGSYAYGQPTPDSDVALLVIMNTKAKEINRYVTASSLLYPRQFPVDILVNPPQRDCGRTKEKKQLFLT